MAESSGTSWYRVAWKKLHSDLDRGAQRTVSPPMSGGASLQRRLAFPSLAQRSGTGTTGRLRCPLESVAWTAKTTLSFDTGTVAWVTLPNACACSQSAAPVSLHNTRYPLAMPPGDASHTRVESFCRPFVNTRTFAGDAGADASEASAAAFTRATLAT